MPTNPDVDEAPAAVPFKKSRLGDPVLPMPPGVKTFEELLAFLRAKSAQDKPDRYSATPSK